MQIRFLESISFLIFHEGDEEDVAGSSLRGHGTDGGLSDARRVGLGLDRLDIHPLAQTQVRARAPTLQGALGLLYMTRMCGCSKQGGNEKFIRIWCRSGINHILFIVVFCVG